MKYNTVLFDWDGCLIHTMDAWLIAARKGLADLGHYPTDKEILDDVLNKDDGPEVFKVPDKKDFWNTIIEIYHQQTEHVFLHAGVREALTKLQEMNVKVAVVTRTRKESVDNFLPQLNVDHLIDVFVTRLDVTNQKPDPEGISLALDKLHTDTSQTIMVGDSDHDVLAGKAAGVDTVLFYPPHNEAFYSVNELTALEATYMIHDFHDLINIVEGE